MERAATPGGQNNNNAVPTPGCTTASSPSSADALKQPAEHRRYGLLFVAWYFIFFFNVFLILISISLLIHSFGSGLKVLGVAAESFYLVFGVMRDWEETDLPSCISSGPLEGNLSSCVFLALGQHP